MRLGIAMFTTDRAWPVPDLAREVEARGLASLAVPEHTHMPVAHTPHPSGRPLPDEYRRLLDPFVALTAAAAVTERLALITGVCLLAQRDPIVTAKAAASLDHLSGGRLVLGVGYGWNRPETAAHGVAFGDRREVLHDHLAVVQGLWTEEVASHTGTHASLAPSWAWPKPDHLPPVLLGAGLGPRTLEAVVTRMDGWLPMGTRTTLAGLAPLRAAWQTAGRPGRPQVHTFLSTPAEQDLAALAAAGVDAATVWLPPVPRSEALPHLDAVARAAAALPPSPPDDPETRP